MKGGRRFLLVCCFMGLGLNPALGQQEISAAVLQEISNLAVEPLILISVPSTSPGFDTLLAAVRHQNVYYILGRTNDFSINGTARRQYLHWQHDSNAPLLGYFISTMNMRANTVARALAEGHEVPTQLLDKSHPTLQWDEPLQQLVPQMRHFGPPQVIYPQTEVSYFHSLSQAVRREAERQLQVRQSRETLAAIEAELGVLMSRCAVLLAEKVLLKRELAGTQEPPKVLAEKKQSKPRNQSRSGGGARNVRIQ